MHGEDLVLVVDHLIPDWEVSEEGGVELLPGDASAPVFAGERALQVRIIDAGNLGWRLTLTAPEPLEADEYGALRMAGHPGDIEGSPRLGVSLQYPLNCPIWMGSISRCSPSSTIDLVGEGLIDVQQRDWQEVAVPLELFELDGEPVQGLRFDGRVEGTFYVDAVRLETRFPRSVTVVQEEDHAIAPRHFALDQNYPNPFNGDTSIRYTLARSTAVELKVYNLAGQQITTLINGMRAVGIHTVSWDGRDDDGKALASGVYIYRLRTEPSVLTKKLLLLR